MKPAPPTQRRFVRRLLRWYRRHGRALPWRRTRDPYRILVSEVMLQQTQVDRVLPKYREFLRRYPSIERLAKARAQEVRELWYPLGYNARPLRLRAIAEEVVRRHNGRLPHERKALLALRGIGPYTAGAVRVFAFDRREAVVDTNIRRVLRRVFIGRPVPERRIWALAEAILPRRAYDFTQALMDFGATVCRARNPACSTCPMADCCRSAGRLQRAAPRVRIQGGEPK